MLYNGPFMNNKLPIGSILFAISLSARPLLADFAWPYEPVLSCFEITTFSSYGIGFNESHLRLAQEMGFDTEIKSVRQIRKTLAGLFNEFGQARLREDLIEMGLDPFLIRAGHPAIHYVTFLEGGDAHGLLSRCHDDYPADYEAIRMAMPQFLIDAGFLKKPFYSEWWEKNMAPRYFFPALAPKTVYVEGRINIKRDQTVESEKDLERLVKEDLDYATRGLKKIKVVALEYPGPFRGYGSPNHFLYRALVRQIAP